MEKILISTSNFNTNNLSTDFLNKLQKNNIEICFNPHKRRLSEDEIIQLLSEDVVGLIAGVEPLTEKVLSSANKLKVISRCGVGIDNVDIECVNRLKIKLFNTPDAPTMAVAEFTLGLILTLLRQIHKADQLIRSSKWTPLMGTLLSSKTIGIIGFGRIGKKLYDLLKGFGARILIYDPIADIPSEEEKASSINILLQQSDIVSLHIPYSVQNRHLISKFSLSQMKTNALLINTSRGELIDETALYQALKANRLGGAALDVFTHEPYQGDLRELSNVVLTAHMSGYARECRDLMETQAIDNLINGLQIM